MFETEPMTREELTSVLNNNTLDESQKRNIIICSYTRLCKSIANSFKINNEDLYNEGLLGLVSAVQKARLEEPTLTGYISVSIRGRILNYLTKENKLNEITNIEMLDSQVEDTTEQVDTEDFKEYIKKDLSEKYQKVLDYLMKDWSIPEIAKEMGYSKQYVYSFIDDLKAKVKLKLRRLKND